MTKQNGKHCANIPVFINLYLFSIPSETEYTVHIALHVIVRLRLLPESPCGLLGRLSCCVREMWSTKPWNSAGTSACFHRSLSRIKLETHTHTDTHTQIMFCRLVFEEDFISTVTSNKITSFLFS